MAGFEKAAGHRGRGEGLPGRGGEFAAPETKGSLREEAFDRLEHYTRERGLKRSRQRDLILERFLRLGGHVSVDEVHADARTADPSVGRATVYRAMRLFLDAGIASSIDLKDGLTRFEPALSRQHHDHLICVRCGRIDEFLSREVEERQDEIAEQFGYRLIWHRHQLYGLCPRCRAAARRRSRPPRA